MTCDSPSFTHRSAEKVHCTLAFSLFDLRFVMLGPNFHESKIYVGWEKHGQTLRQTGRQGSRNVYVD